ncbi:MAG: GxxExxY protein [Syntrophomonadaceae bacterium]|nr:GxxExxY protein [Syntrophomonadaceae bacterium]MDD4550410.1 GxxExxY protein [Syntrophomonadaceae bacterium]
MINADSYNYKYSDLTEKIIGCAYKVYNTLGAGFLEKIYENAMVFELKKQGLKVIQQHPINVYYEGQLMGEYYADLLIEDKVIVELKAISELTKAHETQLVNYLKATGITVGLLINFGDEIKIKRRILSKKKISENHKNQRKSASKKL